MPFTKGIMRDTTPRLQPKGSYRNARNAIIATEDGELRRERGPRNIMDFGGYEVRGSVTLSDEKIVLFLGDDGAEQDRVVLFNPDAEEISNLIEDQDLKGNEDLNLGGHIQATYRKLASGDRVIYWVDDKNPPRILNIDKSIPAQADGLRLFPTMDTAAQFHLDDVTEIGGNLKGGSYQLAFAYVNEDGSTSNYFLNSKPINIPEVGGFGAEKDEKTGRAIRFDLTNLDPSYSRIRIAAVKNTEVEIVGSINYENQNLTYTYTGQESSLDGSLEEILVNQKSYSKVKTIAQQDGTLYMANLEEEGQIDLQRHVNDISLSVRSTDPGVSDKIGEGFSKPENSHAFKTYKRAEAYAFYLTFLLKDGSETDAFHIPGRETGAKTEASMYLRIKSSLTDKYAAGTIVVNNPIPDQGEEAQGNPVQIDGGAGDDDTFDVALVNDSGADQTVVSVSVNSGDSGQTVASAIKSGLNNDGTFSSDWTAFIVDIGNGIWGIVISADQDGSLYNGWEIEIRNDTHITANDTGDTTTGGKPKDAPVDHDILINNNNDTGNNYSLTVNGLDSTEIVAQAYANAINGTAGNDYTATVQYTNEVLVEAKNYGDRFNGTIEIERPDITNPAFDITEGWEKGVDNYSIEVDWGPDFDSFQVNNIYDDTSTSKVMDEIYQKSRDRGYTDLGFRDSGGYIVARYTGDSDYTGNEISVGVVDPPEAVGSWLWREEDWNPKSHTDRIGENHPLHHYNSEFDTDLRKFHISSVPNSTNNTGYWENAEEYYPDTDRWDIVNQYGNERDFTYRNQKVRHHRMPNNKDAPFYDGNDIEILQVKLHNIHIPEKYADDIIGYRLHYAKKKPNQRLIIDQSLGVPAWRDAEQGDGNYNAKRHGQHEDTLFNVPKWNSHCLPPKTNLEGNIGDDVELTEWKVDDSLLQLHPFESLRRDLPIQGVTHLRRTLKLTGRITDKTTAREWRHSYINVEEDDKAYPIKSSAYLDFNQRNAQLSNLGFSQNFDNIFGESKVVAELDNNNNTGTENLGVMDLCTLRTNIHRPFDSQKLEWTGYTGTISEPNTDNSSDWIAGGDINISPWSYKIHGIFNILNIENHWDSGDWWQGRGDVVLSQWGPSFQWAFFIAEEDEWGDSGLNPVPQPEKKRAKGLRRAIQELIGNLGSLKEPPVPWSTIWFQMNETRDNPHLRTQGNKKGEYFLPKDPGSYPIDEPYTYVGGSAPDDEFWEGLYRYPDNADKGFEGAAWPSTRTPEKFENISDPDIPDKTAQARAEAKWLWDFYVKYDNRLKYNQEYSEDNDLKPAFPHQDTELNPNSFETRIIRSAATKSGGRRTAWREFLTEDALDLPQNRGAIMNLAATKSGLLIHTEESLFRTQGRKELDAQGAQVYIGSGDIFETPPQEFKDLETGFAGLTDPRHARVTPWGYMWVDVEAQKVYTMGIEEGIKDASRQGLRDWFNSNITDNSDLRIGADPEGERVFLTDQQAGWTLSYNPYREMWVSFHDLDAEHFLFNRNRSFHTRNGEIYEIGDGDYGDYYGNLQPFNVRFVNAEPTPEGQIAVSLLVDCAVYDDNGLEIENDTIDTVQVWNDHQDTGEINVLPVIGERGQRRQNPNTRKTDRVWKINDIRDQIAHPNQRGKLERLNGNTHLIEVSFGASTANRTIHLLNSMLVRRTSKR